MYILTASPFQIQFYLLDHSLAIRLSDHNSDTLKEANITISTWFFDRVLILK